MGLILDTSVIIAAERDEFDLNGLLETYGEEPVRIAALTASELLHGGNARLWGDGGRSESVLSNVC